LNNIVLSIVLHLHDQDLNIQANYFINKILSESFRERQKRLQHKKQQQCHQRRKNRENLIRNVTKQQNELELLNDNNCSELKEKEESCQIENESLELVEPPYTQNLLTISSALTPVFPAYEDSNFSTDITTSAVLQPNSLLIALSPNKFNNSSSDTDLNENINNNNTEFDNNAIEFDNEDLLIIKYKYVTLTQFYAYCLQVHQNWLNFVKANQKKICIKLYQG
ncbi:19898_t:CDS:2, partial [Racocetra fulgida]